MRTINSYCKLWVVIMMMNADGDSVVVVDHENE